MVLYLRKRPEGGLLIVKDDGIETFAGSPNAWCDSIALRRLSTRAAAQAAAAKVLSTRRLVPLFLDAGTMMVPLGGFRSEGCLLLNAFAISACASRPDGGATARFRDGTRLEVPSAAVLRRGMRLSARLLRHLTASGNE
ncbi:MAG: hypothetical protein WC509_07310 [Candidatus Izemoplasmatales bacterium]